MAAVTYLMLIELTPTTAGWPYWDKVQHIAVFTLLTTAACLAFPQKTAWITAGLLSYGALIEVLQSLLTITRMASVGDWLADATGVVVLVVTHRMLVRRSNKRLGEM